MGLRSFFKKAIRIAAPIAGAVFGGPLGGAIGGALSARVAGRSATKGALAGALLAPAAVGGFAALRQGASFADIARVAGQTLTTGGPRFQTVAENFLQVASPPGAPPLPQATAMSAQLVPTGGGGGFPQLMDDTGRIVSPGGGLVPTGALGLGRAFGGAVGGLTRMSGNLLMSAAGRIRGVIGLGGQFIASRRVMSGAKILGLAGTSAALGITVDEVAQIVMQESVKRRRARGLSAGNLRTTRRVTKKIISMHQDLSRLCGQSFRLRSRVVKPS